MADDIARAGRTKPITAVADGLAASAAYWLGAQAGHFVVTPSGEVGSIGVYALHVDASRAVDAEGLTPTFISAGISPFKTEATPLQPLTPDARAFVQSQVDEIGQRFVSAVARGRKVSESRVLSLFGKGRMLLAPAAHRFGMIDDIQTFDQALARALGPKRGGPAVAVTPSRPVAKFNARMRRLDDLAHGGGDGTSPRQNLVRVLAREGKVYADKAADARDEAYWRQRIAEQERA